MAALVREGKFEEAEQLVHEFNLEPEVMPPLPSAP